jgi:hypothetical protein
MIFLLTGDFCDANDRVPDLVGVEDVRRQRITAPVPDTALGVDPDASHRTFTRKVSGNASTDRSPRV